MTVITPSGAPLASRIAEYRHCATLLVFLTLRDIRLRYRHTLLGILWAVAQPVLPMLIFAAVFSRTLRFETGAPYFLFVFAGLAPWMFLANAVNSASTAFISNYNLLNKVYFPRAILPAAAVFAFVIDWLVAGAVLAGLCAWNGFAPQMEWLALPAIVPAGVFVAMVAGLGAASLSALFRDMKTVVPFLVQVWMYATPVFYPLDVLPAAIRRVIGFNPMTGVVEAFRACLFGRPLDWTLIAQSAVATVVLTIAVAMLFNALEADLAEQV
ncbi:MAG: ABC transporter permease [Acidobacteriia bacterium]|nr:ABC transporter permease [Terriglobia bacterium]